MATPDLNRLTSLVVIICVVLVALLISLPLFRGEIYGGHDFVQQDLPMRIMYAHGLKNGRLDLWNPHLFRGFSQHAEGQTGMCHPLRLLLYWALPIQVACVVDCFWPFAALFAGMYLFLRRWMTCSGSALFGAAAYAFSSFHFAHTEHMALLAVHSHFPWIFFAVDGLLREKQRFFYAAALCVILASGLLLGHPPMVWMMLFAAFVYCCCLFSFGAVRNKNEVFSLAAIGLAWAILLAAVQILPTYEAVQVSARGHLAAHLRYGFQLNPYNLIQFVAPYYFPRVAAGTFVLFEGEGYQYFSNPAELTIYPGLGLLSMTLVLLTAFRRQLFFDHKKGLIIAMASTGLLGFLLMLGSLGGLYSLLNYIPVVREFRSAARYVTYIHFSLALISALVLDAFLSGEHAERPRPFTFWLLPVLSCLAAAVGIAIFFTVENARTVPSNPEIQLISPAIAATASLLLYLSFRKRNVLVFYVAFALLDLAFLGLRVLHIKPTFELAQINQLVSVLDKESGRGNYLRVVTHSNIGIWSGAHLANGYSGLSPIEPLEVYADDMSHFRLSSVSHYLRGFKWIEVDNPVPRFRFVEAAVYDAETTVKDLLAVARLSDDSAPLPFLESGAAAFAVMLETPSTIEISVRVEDGPKLFVCSDRYDPDWRVYIDEMPVPLLPLYNHGIRGVIVNPGDKKLVFKYEPSSFFAGGRISLFALAVLLFVAGFYIYKK